MENNLLRLAENIHVLQKICNKPILPTSNKLIDTGHDEGRQLNLRRELEVVEDLTLLSTYSDDSENVMALCIQEQPDHHGMIISIATNTGASERLRKGLQSIVEPLIDHTGLTDFLLWNIWC